MLYLSSCISDILLTAAALSASVAYTLASGLTLVSFIIYSMSGWYFDAVVRLGTFRLKNLLFPVASACTSLWSCCSTSRASLLRKRVCARPSCSIIICIHCQVPLVFTIPDIVFHVLFTRVLTSGMSCACLPPLSCVLNTVQLSHCYPEASTELKSGILQPCMLPQGCSLLTSRFSHNQITLREREAGAMLPSKTCHLQCAMERSCASLAQSNLGSPHYSV